MPIPDHITKECKLDAIFESQSNLMDIVEKHSGGNGSIGGNILACIVELAELANEEGSFKWWKKTQANDKDAQLEELVDVLFFWTQTAIKLGFNPSQVFTAYMKKWQKNVNRQLDNY